MRMKIYDWFLAMTAASLLVAGNLLAADSPRSPAPKLPDPDVQGDEIAVLGVAPNVPPPITRKHAAKVKVSLEVLEVTKRLADGVDYVFWTFGGDVPGRFIRIREGDEVEFHLNNHQDLKQMRGRPFIGLMDNPVDRTVAKDDRQGGQGHGDG